MITIIQPQKKENLINIPFITLNGIVQSEFLFFEELFPELMLTDGALLCTTITGINKELRLYNPDGILRWKMEVGYFYVRPIVYAGAIFFHHKYKQESEIIRLSLNGEVEATFSIPQRGSCCWDDFLFDDNGSMYYSASVKQDKSCYTCYLYCFDYKLNTKFCIDLDQNKTSFSGMISINKNTVFVSLFEKEIISVDTNTGKIKGRKQYTDCFEFCGVDAKDNVIIKKNNSTVEVLDHQMNIISRHKLKGNIYKYYKSQDGSILSFPKTKQVTHVNPLNQLTL